MAQAYPIWLGGLATGMASTFTHPLDLVKVQMQTQEGKIGVFKTFGTVLGRRGFRGLFDGLSAAWFRAFTYNMTRFEAYGAAKRYLDKSQPTFNPLTKGVLAGAWAGIIGGTVSNPGDIVLVRMQSDLTKPLADRYAYKNVFHGLWSVLLNEGPIRLFRGLDVTIVRAMITNIGQLASYDVFKQVILNNNVLKDGPLCHLLASFGAGTCVTMISQPADVIRSRLMAAQAKSQVSVLNIARTLVQTERVLGLWKGFVPAWTRHTPQTVLTFIFLEQLRGLVDVYRQRDK